MIDRMPLSCRLGFHAWSLWRAGEAVTVHPTYDFLPFGYQYSVTTQSKHCMRCSRLKIRRCE